MNEASTVEFRVRLLGEGTDFLRPTKASNIGDGHFQLHALNLYVEAASVSMLLDLRSKTMLLNPRRK